MNRWVARLLAITLTAAAVYLVYANVHAGNILLECTLAAAVLAIATVLLVWKRPVAAVILNVVWIAGAFVASALLTPNRQVPNIAASAQSAQSRQQSAPAVPSGSSASAPSSDTLTVPPSPLPSLKPATGALSAPQAGFDYSYFIGPGTIDDGMTAGETGKAAASAVGKVVSAFSTATEPPQSPQTAAAQSIRDAAAKIPESEYSLVALAQTLPNDPIAIYRFVRDNVDVDGYNGIMRGPLGTWLSRSGSPSDKLSLMAWLLVNKGIPLQFVRGTLSPDDQKRIGNAVNEPMPASATFEDDRVRTAAEQYVKDGTSFASWASNQLKKANVAVGTASRPPATRHYWVQIDRNGQVFDLDPTLPDMTEGQHLGALDSTFKPWAILPDDEWHYVQARVTADFADGTSQNVVTYTGKTEYVAYAPLRIAIVPHGASDFSTVATARSFDVVLLNGGVVADNGTLDLDAHGGVRDVKLAIRRKDTDGTILTSVRDLLAQGVASNAQGPSLAGLTTILVVPGVGSNLFTLHAYLRSVAALTEAAAAAKGGKPQPVALYPTRIADYFSRDDVVAEKLAGDSRVRFYRNRPNVALQRTTFAVGSGGSPATLFDIVDNTMTPAAPMSQELAQANLARGYADAEIERDVSGEKNAVGAIAVFDAAKSAGVGLVVAANAAALPQTVRPLARGIDGAFKNGNVVIALQNSVSLGGSPAYGWWDVDAATGNAVGRISGGAGGMAEYAWVLRAISTTIWIAEMAQTAHECSTSGEDCFKAICSQIVASIFMGAGWKHAAHFAKHPTLNGLIGGVAMAVISEVFVAKGVGEMCGSQGGGGGHGGHE